MLLTLNNIMKTFKDFTALDDISFDIDEGEIFGFLGPSGAGKTTTIKIVTGQLKPTQGFATVLGVNTTELDENIYEQIGIVSDTSGVYERLSVYENLKIYADILGVDYSEIDKLLIRMGLEDKKKLAAGKLSKGQKQRLLIARAIIHKPRLLFLDEPTSGLDPTTAKQIQDLFLELKSEGMGIFLTTHNMDEASKLCDKIALLDKGHIIEFGSPKDICLRHNTDKKYKVELTNKEVLILEHQEEDLKQLETLLLNDEVETLHSCEPSLEDVFIKVTGRLFE